MSGTAAVTPEVMGALAERAPARLVRKLDADPRMAESWAWSADADSKLAVVTDSGETVTLTLVAGVLESADAIACSCLLSPKCLHVLAVARALPLADAPVETRANAPADAETRADAPMDAPLSPAVAETALAQLRLDEDGRAAASALFAAAKAALVSGVDALGAVREGELLRAIHGARALGLHRLAAAGLRLVRSARALRERRPESSLPEVADALTEALACASMLARDAALDPAWLGTARRAYAPAGNLRLHGLFTEAVTTTTGYSGVVTYLCDAEGRLYSLSKVLPGDPAQARAAYDGSAAIGDASLSHRALGREGLFVANATASADGRLGSGAAVRAVRSGASSWSDPAPRALFAELETQLDRARASLRVGPLERRAGWDLLFLEGTLLGATRTALLLSVATPAGPIALRCAPASDHVELGHHEAFTALAHAPGLAVRVIGRVRFDAPRTLELLAVGPSDASAETDASDPSYPSAQSDDTYPALLLPSAHHGRANLAFDLLRVENAAPMDRIGPREEAREAYVDPLDALRRRLLRAALGGRATFPPEADRAIEAEALALEARMMPMGAELLRELSRAARSHDRTLAGRSVAADPAAFARAWLRAARYVEATAVALQAERWR